MTYTCKTCGTTSDVSDFYSGVKTYCKECHKAAVKANRAKNADRYRAYDAERFRNDQRVRERHRRYQKTPAGKASVDASRKKWMSASPEKRAAHVILGNAVRDGRIEKPKACERCGKVEGKSRNIHGHHDDYAFPLNVIWLCVTCHKAEHK